MYTPKFAFCPVKTFWETGSMCRSAGPDGKVGVGLAVVVEVAVGHVPGQGVGVDVAVCVAVGVPVAVSVGVGVGVFVGVLVGHTPGHGVAVGCGPTDTFAVSEKPTGRVWISPSCPGRRSGTMIVALSMLTVVPALCCNGRKVNCARSPEPPAPGVPPRLGSVSPSVTHLKSAVFIGPAVGVLIGRQLTERPVLPRKLPGAADTGSNT